MKWITPAGDRYTLYKDMLEHQPHLMIAGATGSGKSVIVNALIYTALYKFPLFAESKDSVGFILVDPKRVELSKYKNLPHTLRYASEPAEMVAALKYAMDLTENRYREMQKAGEDKYSGGDVFVIIDEMADLMTTNRKQVQPLVQRLAQIGRAAKVHIILCTQCPLAKVIPTEIKVNFDARVALRTECAQDSRNIIRVPGCEQLPRYGQGYYKTPEGITLYNIPMIPQEELSARIKWWMDQKAVDDSEKALGHITERAYQAKISSPLDWIIKKAKQAIMRAA